MRNSDMVARLGGDEFIVLLEDIGNEENAARVALNIIKSLSNSFTLLQHHSVQIGTSIGISLYPHHGHEAVLLLDNADKALYQAKNQGRGCYAYFSKDLTVLAQEKLDLEQVKLLVLKPWCVGKILKMDLLCLVVLFQLLKKMD